MSIRTAGRILAALGVVVALIGLTADAIGFGGSFGFGLQQTAAVIVGLLAAGIGLLLARR